MKKSIAILLALVTVLSAFTVAISAEEIVPGEEMQEEPQIEQENVLPEEESVEQPTSAIHKIIIANERMEKGYVIPSKRTAREGNAIVLTAMEKEYTENGKTFKEEFVGFETESDVEIIRVNATTAFFFMPDEDITITANYRTLDLTEYYDWDSVIEKIGKMKDGEELTVDMKKETVIPKKVLDAFDGTNVTVSFMTDNSFYSINGENMSLDDLSEDGYKFTYEDYDLTRYYRLKLQNSAVTAIEVTAETPHEIAVALHCFCNTDANAAYLYRIDGRNAEFISLVSVKNGETTLPITESGIYAVTTKVLAGTEIMMKSDADKQVLLNGKLLPLVSYADGEIHFTVENAGSLAILDFICPYTDIKNHVYEDAVKFVTVRNLMDGADDSTFYPNAGVSVEDMAHAIARMRQISDKSAMAFCEQSGIFSVVYEEGSLLTRNDVSLIMTSFVNYLVKHPEQFGALNPEAFENNAAAWVGARFAEMAGTVGSFDWSGLCTKGELAYLLTAVVNTAVNTAK